MEYEYDTLLAILAINPHAKVSIINSPGGEENIEWLHNTEPISLEDIRKKKSELIRESSHIEPRKRAYIQSLGSVEDQLDMIYHDFDGWKLKVKEIKDMHPKYK